MEWDLDQKLPGCWTIAARVARPQADDERKIAAEHFGVGATVYCLPPARNDPEAELKVVGYTGRFHRLAHGVLLVRQLKHWHPEYVTDPRLTDELNPPWDGKDDSRAMASLICAWQEGGPWPAAELRDWNRTQAQRIRGHGGPIKRLMHHLFGTSKRQKGRRT